MYLHTHINNESHTKRVLRVDTKTNNSTHLL